MIACVGVVSPKHAVNVAAVLRATKCHGANFVVYSGKRYQKHSADTASAIRDVPLFYAAMNESIFDYVPFGCVPVAVDLVENAISLVEYEHPEQAFYVFGPEDGTLGHRTLSKYRDRVYVPTNGCMNLAATVNVVLYDRRAKWLCESNLYSPTQG